MSIRKVFVSAALLLFCLGVAHGSGRVLAEAPAPAHFIFSNSTTECTPGNVLRAGTLGGLNGHGWHQSLACSPGEIITSITLGTTAWEPYTPCSIAIQCTPSAFGTTGMPTTKNFTLPSARSSTTNFTTLASDDGFNSASVFTSNETANQWFNLGMTINPIVEMSFGTADSRSISAGTPGGTITGDLTKQAVFDIPSNARITWLSIFYMQYINSVSVGVICPNLAGSGSVSPPADAVQG